MVGKAHVTIDVSTLDQQIRFLALGDSYTIGESVTLHECWPNQLSARLRADQIQCAPPQIIAKTGWTTRELIDGIEVFKLTETYALVSLLIGVNNQYRGLCEDEYVDELELLLAMAVGFAGGDARRVIVLSIPDWSVTPFASDRDCVTIAAEIDSFNRRKRECTRRNGCHFIDITPISRRASQDRALLAEDGLHPSGSMYAEWCEQVLPIAKDALASRPPIESSGDG